MKTHRLSAWYHKGTFYNAHNFCIHRYHCKKTNACGKIILCGVKFASYPNCNQTCRDCDKLIKAPYVCNGCTQGSTTVRSHTNILIMHALRTRSITYTYLDKELFTTRNINLKRKVGFKPKKCHKTQITNRVVFTNRLYSDFCGLNLSSFVEMDTVHSSRESKKNLLTLFFTKEKLFLTFPINRCTKGAVRLVFDRLEKRMGTYEFVSVFEYILTDRGSEFGDPDALETNINGIRRSSFYYCDPYAEQSERRVGTSPFAMPENKIFFEKLP